MVRADTSKQTSQTSIQRTGRIRDPSRYYATTTRTSGRKDDRTTHPRLNWPYAGYITSPLSGVWSVRLGGRKGLGGAPIMANHWFNIIQRPAKPQVVISGSTQRFEAWSESSLRRPSNGPRRFHEMESFNSPLLIQPRCQVPSMLLEFRCSFCGVPWSAAFNIGIWNWNAARHCGVALGENQRPNHGSRPTPTLPLSTWEAERYDPSCHFSLLPSEVTTGYRTSHNTRPPL